MRIAFFTDLHFGGTAAGFTQQRRFVGGAAWVTAQLAGRARAESWDLLVNGGDIVEEATGEQIDGAAALCRQIACPTLICLGNHDVNRADAMVHWKRNLELWPQARLAEARVDGDGLTIMAISNPWVDALGVGRLYWEPGTGPNPTLLAEQVAWLEKELSMGEGPAIVCIHCPTHAILPEQTGLANAIHESPEAYGELLNGVLNRHPRVRLVLSGHNHVSCAASIHGRIHASVSAVGEAPYQYVVVEAKGREITVETRSLGQPAEGPEPDPAKPWVSGRPMDRCFTLPR